MRVVTVYFGHSHPSLRFDSFAFPVTTQDDFLGVPEGQLRLLVDTMQTKLLQTYHGCTITHDTSTGGRGTIEICAGPSQIADARADCYKIMLAAVATVKKEKEKGDEDAGDGTAVVDILEPLFDLSVTQVRG